MTGVTANFVSMNLWDKISLLRVEYMQNAVIAVTFNRMSNESNMKWCYGITVRCRHLPSPAVTFLTPVVCELAIF